MAGGIDGVRKSLVKTLSRTEENGFPKMYVRSPLNNKMVGTIHYSKVYGFYWIPWNSLNCYMIKSDGSLGLKIQV